MVNICSSKESSVLYETLIVLKNKEILLLNLLLRTFESVIIQGEKSDSQFAKGLSDDLVETSYKISSAYEVPKEILRGDLEFKSADDDHRSGDECIIDSLRELEKPRSTSELVGCSHLANINLDANLRAKILPNGCVHADFSPRNDVVILATGDKQGSVGFWKPPLGNGVFFFLVCS